MAIKYFAKTYWIVLSINQLGDARPLLHIKIFALMWNQSTVSALTS